MHEALGLAGGAGGEEHVRRVVEGQRLRLQPRPAVASLGIGEQVDLEESVAAGHAARRDPGDVDDIGIDRTRQVVGPGDDEHRAHARQFAHEFDQVIAALVALARPLVGRRADEYDGIELAEAIDDRGHAELRRRARHHRPHRQAGEGDHESIDADGQHECDAIPRHDPPGPQGCRGSGHALDELLTGERRDDADAVSDLGGLHDDGEAMGIALGHRTQVGVDDVETRAGEEARLREHRGLSRYLPSCADDAEVIPHQRPEGIRLGDGPGLQVVVRREIRSAPLARCRGECRHPRGCRLRREHRVAHGGILSPGPEPGRLGRIRRCGAPRSISAYRGAPQPDRGSSADSPGETRR